MLGFSTKTDFLHDKTLVDLGCGDQYTRKAFEGYGESYWGIDIDQCDLEKDAFPFAAESTDIVICLALIEHLSDPGHFLTEIKRILKPGGLVWISTPDIKACGADFWNDPTHMHPYTRTSLRMLLQMHGYADVLITPNYHCKPNALYRDTDINFFRARHLMPFAGTSWAPVPEFLKGHCTGLFAIAKKLC